MNDLKKLKIVENFLMSNGICDFIVEKQFHMIQFHRSALSCVPIRGFMTLDEIRFDEEIYVTISDSNHEKETFAVKNFNDLIELLKHTIEVLPKLELLTRKYMQFV